MIKKYSLLAALLFAFTFTARAETPPKEIRFGEVGGTNVQSSGGKPTGVGIVSLAEHLGFFEQEFGKDGPKINQIYFAGTGPAQNEALAQGSIDFGTYGGVPNVVGLTGGVPAHIIATRRASGTGSYYIGVRPDSPIKSVTDLKGKRITVQKGTSPYQTLIKLLESKGLKEKDVNIVNLPGGEALVAFNAGAVDAVFGSSNVLLLRDQGKVRIPDDAYAVRLPQSQSGILVADKFEKEYPDTLRRIVKVLTRTSAWASEEKNREQLLQWVSSRSLAYKYVAEDYKGSLLERFNPLIDDSSVAAYQNTVRFSVEHKLIRKEVSEATVRGWFRPQYQQQAIKELKLEGYWPSESAGKKVAAR